MVAVTGIRGNGCLSLDRPSFEDFEGFKPEMSTRWRYLDAKHKRPAFAIQTIREWWDLWGPMLVPEELKPYWIPCDQRPGDEQMVNANKLLSTFTGLLRRKVHPEAPVDWLQGTSPRCNLDALKVCLFRFCGSATRPAW